MTTMELTLLLILVLGFVLAEDDWTSKCSKCKCMWSSGKKSADCKNVQLSEIPKDLSSELRDIDFSNNQLYELKSREFSTANIQDVHKLRLQNCSIQLVQGQAFDNLRLLIELDLSNNAIEKLDKNIFRDNTKLRMLFLSHNKLRKLDVNMFANMTHLQKIHVDNNQLEYISAETFGRDCPLQHLSLENNRLTYIAPTFSDELKKLSSLDLAGNLWVCDCKLQPFRKLALDNSWITRPITCEQPERVKGRKWSDTSVVFACDPKIVEPSPNAVVEVDTANYTIPCKVEGDPRPSVIWMSNGRNVDPQRNAQKFYIASSREAPYWDNLTIINISYRDRGEYKCVATNAGGSDERNVTLYLRGTDYLGGSTLSSTSMSSAMILMIALIVGAVALIVAIFLLICCCCKRNGRNARGGAAMSKSRPISQSNEFISLDGRPGGELEKSLLTDVNPVTKPPRQYSLPPSVTSGGTEVSDAKRMLIDDESNYTGDDESRAYDFVGRTLPKSQNHLDIDFRCDNLYPPDLLSFPPRGANQISPAGSSASTVADTTRLPSHHPQSPVHSPLYETSAMYRTLPYSRSHSPFTSPQFTSPHIRVPRQGAYVTIPRRPRASWSSEPPNMLSDIGEPLYDNLGLRTTATGASALSLNKLSEATTPKQGQRAQAALLSPQTCDPIAEHESPPTAATLPRVQRALSPNLEAMHRNWARSPEGLNDSRRESTASLLPSEGKTPKIPPRPPPKPKKRTSTGPLFEDEGEDGTEV